LRVNSRIVAAVVAIVGAALWFAPGAHAQNPDTIPAEQSAAMTKAILQQLIGGLGGREYLTARDSDCTGRLNQFGQYSGTQGGSIVFHEYRIFPDKLRREYSKKRLIIDIYNGDQGWSLDKGGVEDGDAVAIANFAAGVKMSLDNLLRFQLGDPSLYFHYAGEDVVDLHDSDWVEIEDTDGHKFRIAVARETHLPVRFVVVTRNPQTEDETQDVTVYSNWQLAGAVETPFQVSRSRDDKRVSQTFYETCKYNVGLSPEMFTRQSLVDKWRELGHKNAK
jgi:hypothetical protein